jgi:hypothetical protein
MANIYKHQYVNSSSLIYKLFYFICMIACYYYKQTCLLRDNKDDERSARRHESSLEPHPELSVSVAS